MNIDFRQPQFESGHDLWILNNSTLFLVSWWIFLVFDATCENSFLGLRYREEVGMLDGLDGFDGSEGSEVRNYRIFTHVLSKHTIPTT